MASLSIQFHFRSLRGEYIVAKENQTKERSTSNMNFFAISMILALIACSMAFPTIDEYEVEERADRQRRVTCDLLSAGGFVGDTACAANCLSMGKAGGSCSGGICQCRTTTFAELWNRRFGG